ncbi:MAG: hypothetical protein EXR79_16600 [Myxococcales bacterium]|nr:hypothetical protein [Myxococcales bacterium]
MRSGNLLFGKALLGLSLVLAACDVGTSEPPMVSGPFVDTVMTTDAADAADSLPPPATLNMVAPRERAATAQHRPWRAGHAIAHDGNRLAVADPWNGTLVVLDAATLTVQRTIAVGPAAHRVVAKDGIAWVAARNGSQVVRVDLETGAAQPFDVGPEPTGLALSDDGKVLFVTSAGSGQLQARQAKDGAPIAIYTTQARPMAVAAGDGGRLLVVHQSGALTQLTWKPEAGEKGFQQPVSSAVLPTSLVAGCGGGTPVSTRAMAVDAAPDRAEFAVAHVVARPGDVKSATSNLLAAASAQHKAALSAPGSAPDKSSNGYGGSGNPSGEQCQVPQPHRPIEVAASRVMTGGKPAPASAAPLAYEGVELAARVDQPEDIAYHPVLRVAFLVGRGSDDVVALHEDMGMAPFAVARLDAGSGPTGIAIAPSGGKAWVVSANRFRVTEISLLPLVGLQAPIAATVLPVLRESAPYAADPLSAPAQLGRTLYFGAYDKRVTADHKFACATCHLDGGEDRLVWFVTDGPRQTPALAGRMAGTAPFNWAGSEQKLQDNMTDTMHRMGGLGLPPVELAALEAFLLEGLAAAPPSAPVIDAGAIARGRDLFLSPEVGCGSCHLGGTGTDGKVHDVGTATLLDNAAALLRAGQFDAAMKMASGKVASVAAAGVRFNTPSLRNLAITAPYFHDGSMATIEKLITLSSDHAKMGNTATLTATQKADLAAYLRTL